MTSVRIGFVRPAQLAATCLCIAILVAIEGFPACARSAAPSGDLRLGPLGITTQAPTLLDLGAGVYDLIGNAHRNQTGALGAELRVGRRWAGIGPAIGTIIDMRGGGMVYAGIDSDLTLGPVVITPLAGFGAWWHGGRSDENLGGTLEFRLSLAAAYAFGNGSRLGIRFGHISNANFHRLNPGENDLMVTYGIPLAL